MRIYVTTDDSRFAMHWLERGIGVYFLKPRSIINYIFEMGAKKVRYVPDKRNVFGEILLENGIQLSRNPDYAEDILLDFERDFNKLCDTLKTSSEVFYFMISDRDAGVVTLSSKRKRDIHAA